MRKKRENGMAKESGMGDFPRKQFESVLLHSLRIMDQNREYLQMHLARTGDERTRQLLFHLLSNALRAVSPGGQIKIRLTRDDEDLYLIVEDDGCGLPTGENWMENRRRFLGGVQAGLLLCRRYCAHMGWVLSLTPRGAGSGTRAEVRIPLAGTMFPIEGSVELHTIHPALTTADGLRWQILRELALLSDKME